MWWKPGNEANSLKLSFFILTRNLIFLSEKVSVLLRWSASLPEVAMTT